MGNRRGKITTILTIGILVVIGVTTVISLSMLNKQRSTSARASPRTDPPRPEGKGSGKEIDMKKEATKETTTAKGGKDSGLGVRMDSVIKCSGGSCKLVANDKKNNKKDDNEDTDSQEEVTRCDPVRVACSNACGQPYQCTSDRCGGQTCCPATAACCFSVKLDCSNTCGQPAKCTSDGCGGQSCCSATAACAPTPTPPTYCKSDQSCPINQECYQPPSRSMAYCQPIQCPKQPRGDANCDQAIDPKDYDSVFKPKMIGLPYPCDKCTADFDKNKIVNLLDYEIWRNSVLH